MHERDLLRAFIAAPQRALSRDHLAQATGTYGTNVTRNIEMQIYQLRRKLPGIIQTRRGEGYVFAVRIESV